MANMPVAIPGKDPGEVIIPALGRSFKQIELREDDIYDTVEVASGSLTAGTELILFRDLTNKNEQHTSLKASRRIPSGDEAAVFRVGVYPRGAVGNSVPVFADLKKITENAVLDLSFNRRMVTQGPALKYQSGYGIGGSSTESGATGFAIGVPSAAAAPTLFVPQQLKDDDDINGKLRFPGGSWTTSYAVPVLAGNNAVTVFLHAVIKSPLGK